MNFTDIVNSVVGKVKRPDKIALVREQVNAAMLYFANDYDHPRDLVEFTYTGSSGYGHIIPISSLIRFKKIDWMKYAGTRIYVNPLPSRVLGCDTDIRDKWYEVGDSINVNLSREATSLDISYFRYPPYLVDNTVPYWQLDRNWPAIIARASYVVFNDIGDTASANIALAESERHWQGIKGDTNRGL